MPEEEIQDEGSIFRVAGLVVVNIPATQVSGEQFNKQKWWRQLLQDRDAWITHTCSRVLLVTTQNHWLELAEKFSEFAARCMTQECADIEKGIGNPDPYTRAKPFFLKKEGWDAYTYLLETACGLHSSQMGEDHIAYQILDEGYKEYKQSKHNNRATWFDPVVNELIHDVRQVRKVIGLYIPPTLEDTARDLANIKNGGDVLIVTGLVA